MKLIKFIKKSLGYKMENTNAISSLNDCIPILSREIFAGDEEKLKYLEDIKKEYSDILSKKRTILSMDLNTSNLYEQMNMYIEMLQDLLESEEVDNSFEKAFYYNDGTKKINSTIKMSKLKLYYYRIEKLAIEANVRRMALKELFDEKLFLSSKKKNSIKEEMNYLAGSLLIYTNQIQAIKLQLNSYLMNYETLGKEEFVEEEIEIGLLEKKQEELGHMIEEFMPEKKEFINKSDNRFLNIAYMEEALSKHIYKHKKEEVEKLREEISLLQEKMKVSITDNFISQIDRLEMKLKTLTLYGHNLMSEEDIFSLYNLKFMTITKNILVEEQNLIEKCNFIELENYEKIIMFKISELLNGNISYLKETFPNDYLTLIRAITEVLKNEQNEFNFIDILKDKKKIGLLLSIERENGLEYYFKRCMQPKEKYNSVNFHEHILQFLRLLPLDTIYSMMYYNEEISSEPLYEIYKIFKKENDKKNKFDFPMGLTKINIPSENLLESDEKFIQKIRKLCHYKDIEFPISLREFSGSLFAPIDGWKSYEVGHITFHEGIKKMSNGAFYDIKAKSINFPSSIETIAINVFSCANIKDIYFNNYKELRLNKKSLRDLVMCFFIILKKDCEYNLEGREPVECEIVTHFDSITFLEDTGAEVSIDRTELEEKTVFTYEVGCGGVDLSLHHIETIICKVKQLITNKKLEKKIGLKK